MISPEYQQNVSQETIRLMQNLEENVLIAQNKRLIVDTEDIFEWQRVAMSQTDALRKEITEIVENATPEILNEMKIALNKAGYKIVNDNEQMFDKAISSGYALNSVPTVSESQRLLNILLSYQNVTEDSIKSINNSLIAQANSDYTKIVNESVSKVLTGTQDITTAVRESVNKISATGIDVIERNNRKYNVDSAINTLMRTQTNNVAIDMQDERMAEYGHSIIEVSSHADARTLCAKDQGKLYDKSNQLNGVYSGETVRPFNTTSFGEPAGLFGINCRHVYYPYFLGLSERIPKPATQPVIKKNAKERDKQRYLEREKRNAKRELVSAESRNDEVGIKRAKAKIEKRNAQLRQLTKETGRTRRYNREQI